jgi:hypothetical protein
MRCGSARQSLCLRLEFDGGNELIGKTARAKGDEEDTRKTLIGAYF